MLIILTFSAFGGRNEDLNKRFNVDKQKTFSFQFGPCSGQYSRVDVKIQKIRHIFRKLHYMFKANCSWTRGLYKKAINLPICLLRYIVKLAAVSLYSCIHCRKS